MVTFPSNVVQWTDTTLFLFIHSVAGQIILGYHFLFLTEIHFNFYIYEKDKSVGRGMASLLYMSWYPYDISYQGLLICKAYLCYCTGCFTLTFRVFTDISKSMRTADVVPGSLIVELHTDLHTVLLVVHRVRFIWSPVVVKRSRSIYPAKHHSYWCHCTKEEYNILWCIENVTLLIFNWCLMDVFCVVRSWLYLFLLHVRGW